MMTVHAMVGGINKESIRIVEDEETWTVGSFFFPVDLF